MFIAFYVAYLPAILMLLVFKSYYGILATMLCIGFAAGMFKPLVASTVRVPAWSFLKVSMALTRV